MDHFVDTATVPNTGAEPLVLVVEPWGREYQVPPGVTYFVHAEATVAGKLESERGLGRFTCWAWPGSVVEVRHGKQVIDSLDTAVPEVPRGMSVRSFIRGLLGEGKTG